MAGLIYCAVNNHRFLPRVRDPDELRARLAGEYHASSDEDISLAGYSGISELDPVDLTDVSSAAQTEAQVRRRNAEGATTCAAEEEFVDHNKERGVVCGHSEFSDEDYEAAGGPSMPQHPKQL